MRDEVWLQDKIDEHRRMHPESHRLAERLLTGVTPGQLYDPVRRETTRDLADELEHVRRKHCRHNFEKMLRVPREESKVPSTSSAEVMHRLRHHWDHLHGLQRERAEAHETIDRYFERCSQTTRHQIEAYERELPELCRSEAAIDRARFIETLGRQARTVFVTNPFRLSDIAAAATTTPSMNSTRPPKATKRRKEVIHIRKRSTQSFICLSSSSEEEEEKEEDDDDECDKQDCMVHVGKKRKQELPTVTTTDVVEPLSLLLPPPLIYNLLTEGVGAFTTELFMMLGPMELFNVYKTSQEMRRLLHTCLCEWLRAMLPEFGPMKRHNKLYFTDVNVMALYLGYTETGGTRDPHHFVPQLLRTVHALRSYLTDVGDLLAHSEVDRIQLSGERTPFLFVLPQPPQNNTLIPIAPLSRFNVYTSRCYDRVQESVAGRHKRTMAPCAPDCWEDDDWLLLFDQHDWESLCLRPLQYTAPVAAYTHEERLTFFVVDPLDQSIKLVHRCPSTQWKRLNTITGRRHFVCADFTGVSSTSAIANVLDYYAVRQAVDVAVYGGDGSYQSNYVAACDAYAFSQQKLQELVPPPLLSVAVCGSDD